MMMKFLRTLVWHLQRYSSLFYVTFHTSFEIFLPLSISLSCLCISLCLPIFIFISVFLSSSLSLSPCLYFLTPILPLSFIRINGCIVTTYLLTTLLPSLYYSKCTGAQYKKQGTKRKVCMRIKYYNQFIVEIKMFRQLSMHLNFRNLFISTMAKKF